MLKRLLKSMLIGLGIGCTLLYVTSFISSFNEIQIDDSEVLLPFGSFSFNDKLYKPVIRIMSSDGACSAVVIDDRYALTAAHCVTNFFNRLDTSIVFSVFDEEGNFTFRSAKPVAAHLGRDVALLTGDFKNFAYVKVDFMGIDPLDVGDQLTSCGFPSAQELVYCVRWKLSGSYDFRHLARGVTIQKGCSGGPVLNRFGNVIGVNSAVSGEDFLIGPVVGVFNDFGIEPR